MFKRYCCAASLHPASVLCQIALFLFKHACLNEIMLWDNFIHFFISFEAQILAYLSISFDAKRCFLIFYSFFLAMCLINTTPDFGLQFLFWMLKPLYTCSLVTKF